MTLIFLSLSGLREETLTSIKQMMRPFKSKIVLIAASVLFVCSSCEKDVRPDNDGLIPLSFGMDVSRTKSIIENRTELENSGSNVVVFGSYQVGSGAPATILSKSANSNGINLYYSSGWKYDNVEYWVNDALHRFAAVYPSTGAGSPSFSVAEGQLTLDCTAGLQKDSPDLMYSFNSRDLSQSDDYRPVPFEMNHACAAVEFVVNNGSTKTITNVGSPRLYGIYSKEAATILFNGTPTWTSSGAKLSDSSTEYFTSGTVYASMAPDENIANAKTLFSEGYMIVVPQNVDANDDAKFTFSYTYNGTPKTPVFNLKGHNVKTWLPGRKYTYYITVHDDYITFRVSVKPWDVVDSILQ